MNMYKNKNPKYNLDRPKKDSCNKYAEEDSIKFLNESS